MGLTLWMRSSCWKERIFIHQHSLGDVYANMMAEHLQTLQTAATTTAGAFPTAELGVINAEYTPACAGLPISLVSGSLWQERDRHGFIL